MQVIMRTRRVNCAPFLVCYIEGGKSAAETVSDEMVLRAMCA
jgi:hypothetical protein